MAESQSCDHVWRYRPGKMNVADPVSRAPQHFAPICAAVTLRQSVQDYRAARAQVNHVTRNQSLPYVKNAQNEDAPVVPGLYGFWSARCYAYMTRSRTGARGVPADATARDAGVGQVASDSQKRRRCGSSSSRGGSNTPATGDQRKADQVESDVASGTQDLSYPAREEDVHVTSNYFMKSFFSRVCTAYEHASPVSARIKQEVGYRRDEKGLYWTHKEQLWIPEDKDLRMECIESVHAHPYAGHYGAQRTEAKAKEIYYWPSMIQDVQHYVDHCDSCQRVKALRQKPQGQLHPLSIPGRRWQSVSMDVITDLPVTKRGKDTVVVFVDRLSKMVHLAATTKTVTGVGLAVLYNAYVLKLHGFPKDIVSDRDVRFKGFWRSLHELHGIKLRMSTPLHAQTDGQTENANGVLEDTLRHFVGPFQQDWDECLPAAEFAMNNAWNSSVRNTPFMLNYGQHPDTPATIGIRSQNPEVNKFVGQWSLQTARAKQCLGAAQDRQKKFADRKRKDAPAWQPGNLVLLNIKHFRLQSGIRAKLAPRFIGPFKVVECIGPANLSYRVELPKALSRMHNVFHVSSLREYKQSGAYQPPPVPDIIDNELEWEVQHISSTRGEGARRQYLVHWEGGDLTREPERMLTHCLALLKAFWDSNGLDCPHPLKGLESGDGLSLEGE